MHAQPAEVGVDGAEPVTTRNRSSAEPRDRHVGDDAAAPVQELRVDDRTRPAGRSGCPQTRSSSASAPGPATSIFPNERHVDHPRPLAKGRVLLGRTCSNQGGRSSRTSAGRRRPAATAGPARSSRRVPTRSSRRRRAPRSCRRPCRARDRFGRPHSSVIERIAEAVVVAVGLPRACSAAKTGSRCDSPNRHARYAADVELGLPGRHPLGDRLADPACRRRSRSATAPRPSKNPRTPGIGPSRGCASGVIASGWQTSVTISASCEEREPAGGAPQELLEPVHVGRERARAVLPRHAVDPAGDRVALVAAEHDPARLRLAVDEVVRVAEARHVARQLVAGHGFSATCWWSTGVEGTKAPTIAASCGAQIPAGVHHRPRTRSVRGR